MPNRLAGETSPYLQQHANNPVDWYPWGEEALARARRENKPILLSIGYSACHWCHVMAHESFEDAQVAGLMNDLFVNVKVDREERPDLDQIYQAAHAMLSRRSGGWPLTMFLTPQQEPFFGGTYFPKTSRYGLTGFADLLPQLARAYREQGEAIAEQNERLKAALALTVPEPADGAAALPATAPAVAYASLVAIVRSGRRRLRAGTEVSACGGAGFLPASLRGNRRRARAADRPASRSRAWPKAASTTSSPADSLATASTANGRFRISRKCSTTMPRCSRSTPMRGAPPATPAFEKTARGIVAWLESEMRSPDGGFYSSLDADSEHEEGKFYVWTPDQVKAALDPEEYAVAARHWGLDRAPNFEHAAWHLRSHDAARSGCPRALVAAARGRARLEAARGKLLAARARRVRPGRDDKLLCSWNALMIGALARASRVFDEPSWLSDAQQAADFIRRAMWRDGRLLATYKDGRAHLNAYLDDHAFLLAALIELLQTAFRAQDLAWATEIADALLARFEDRAGGGFFFTSDDHERLLLRPKPGTRQCDAVRQRHRGASPDRAGSLAVGAALPGQRRAHGARIRTRACRAARRLFLAADRSRRLPRAAGDAAAARRPRRLPVMAAPRRTPLSSLAAHAQPLAAARLAGCTGQAARRRSRAGDRMALPRCRVFAAAARTGRPGRGARLVKGPRLAAATAFRYHDARLPPLQRR